LLIKIPIIEDFKIRKAKKCGNGQHIVLPQHWIGEELICFHLSNPEVDMDNDTLTIDIDGVKKGFVTKINNGGAHILIPKLWTNDIILIRMDNYLDWEAELNEFNEKNTDN